MSTVAESRAALESVLALSKLRVLAQGTIAPPSVFVAPGNGWLSPSQLAFGSVHVNWVIVCVVSAANDVAVADIDNLAQAVMLACKGLPTGWGLPVIGTPGVISFAGLPYLGFRAEIQGVL